MVPQHKIAPNPLVSLMRQPKIYIKLPSGGEFWPEGSIDIPENGEFPVYSMTAQDELRLKIPDALMNGQAVVDVIQHCMPNIKNAWKIPNLDMDVILIAIRIATYGEKMSVPVRIGTEFDTEYEVDLRRVIDNLSYQITWDPVVQVSEDLIIYVKPIDYKTMTESALQSFETQKILQLVNNEGIPEEEKLKAFKDSFDRLNALTIGIVNNSVFNIESSAGTTSDPKHIKEFMENIDRDVFDKIKTHIDIQRQNNLIKPLTVPVNDDMKQAGAEGEFVEVPLQFDPASFFG